MLKTALILTCLLTAATACGVDELECGNFCYYPSQYSCTPDPVTSTLQLCAAGTSPCNGACIADCGYFCNATSGLAVPNDEDELFCPPDCSATPGYGACGNQCIKTSEYCCISEKATATASCPFNKPATRNSLDAGCSLSLESIGTLWDGQLRLSFGPGAGPVNFTLNNGELLDNRGQLCYISLGYQIQCNLIPQTNDNKGFGITADGFLTYNNSARFFQCPVGTGGYNIFTQPPTLSDVCTPVAILATSDCPKPQPPTCTKAVDVAVVIDMSGSVSNAQFTAITTFTTNFAKSFEFGASSGRMGLVWFGNTGTTMTSGLLSDRDAFISAANVTRPNKAQSSCVGCGLDLAGTMLNNNARQGVPQVLLLLSDGQSNVPQNTPRGCWKWNGRACVGGSDGVLPAPNWIDEVTKLRTNKQLTVFSIGVVADGNLQEGILKQIASANGYMCIGAYERLVASINRIRDAICPAGSQYTSASPQPTKGLTAASQPTKGSTAASQPTKGSTAASQPTKGLTAASQPTSAPSHPKASTTSAPATTQKPTCPTGGKSIPVPWCWFGFDFDFSGNNVCKDNSGNNRHGTHYGLGAGLGFWKQGAKCTGKKQYISVDKSEDLSVATFSIATWINITSASQQVTIASTNQWALILRPRENKCYFTNGGKTFSWNISVKTGSYFHLTFTFENGAGLLYKDGSSLGSNNCGSLPRNSGNLNLCSHDDNAFEGVFDDLLIFSKCLKSQDIQNIINFYQCL